MSLQIFLQAQLLGATGFLERRSSSDPDNPALILGRCAWLNLFCEVLPRALLAELRLSRMLLGSSSAEQFLLVLTEEDIPRSNELLTEAAAAVAQLSNGALKLVWATTENLGAWPLVRKRLEDALEAATSAPLAAEPQPSDRFAPYDEDSSPNSDSYFASFAQKLPSGSAIGWSRQSPALLAWDEGQYLWPLREQAEPDNDGILFPRRFALSDEGTPASPAELAERAEGTPRWGILLGDVDHLNAQLKRSGTIEEHIHLSVLLKEFFAGELALLCTLPDFWRKVTILYRGGDDFAVLGAWDALLMLARELERLFERFAEQHLQSLPGLEGKSISMSLAIAPERETPLAEVFAQAIVQLEHAKTVETGTFYVFGRAIEWNRLGDAEEVKTSLVRLVRDFGYSPEYIYDLASVYRETSTSRAARRKAIRVDKPWRIYRKLSQVIPQARGKEVANLRGAVITSLIGKRTAALKLRPSARVGLEWARLAAGNRLSP